MNKVEIIGFITSLLAVWLTVKKNKYCWLWNCLSASIYAIYFYDIKLFADSLLQLFFIGISVYGWLNWQTKNEENLKQPIWNTITLTKKWKVIAFLFVISTTLLLGAILSFYTSASIPFLDSFCFSLSILATTLAAFKYLENWIIWILADTIYVGMYIYKDSFLTAILYLILIFLAFNGLSTWKKSKS